VAGPELSIVVASHERPLRLRWLLNALHAQTLDAARWEVVVCHDSRGPETERVLATHPLAAAGNLRSVRLPSGSGTPGANRNAALRLARAPVLVFTDDDCRPPEGWLAGVLEATRRHPGAIVQGPVQGDPDEEVIRRAPYPRTQAIMDVPTPWAECCNIAYPREVVTAVGGFAEDVRVGEDTDLNLRARQAGTPYVGAAEMATYHAIEEASLLDWVIRAWRWGDLAALVRRHPRLRRHLPLGLFWKREHAMLVICLAGLAASRSRGSRLGRLLGWGVGLRWACAHPTHGSGVRARLRQLAGLPGWAVIEGAEVVGLAAASLRHRTILL
jgi:GT2 family glycosyltransferase